MLEQTLSARTTQRRMVEAGGCVLALAAAALLALTLLGVGNGVPSAFLPTLAACALAGLSLLLLARNRQRVEALQASRAELERAQAVAHVGSWRITEPRGVIEWSAETYRIFGIAPGTPIDYAAFLACVHADDRERVRQAWTRALAGDGYDLAHRIVREGSVRWVHERAQFEFDHNGALRCATGTVQDITERQAADAELCHSRQRLRALAAHHQRQMEEERANVAREIHDELGQYLTTLRMDAAMLRNALVDSDPRHAERLTDMKGLIDEAIRAVRRVSGALRPTALDLGLEPALEWLVEDLERRSDIACRLSLPPAGLPAIDERHALPVFRIVQEALTNVVRHAQASQVSIELAAHDDALHVRVSDDGIGFDPMRGGTEGHFGVLGMHERATIQGGSITWSTPPGGGTVLDLRVPNAAPAPHAAPACDECAVLRRMGAH
ncbi:sensor histidine kinase [Pseudazoarcus pumilus]|uniref:Histidine kinase n=1 Tax=Pseudazoarcus pumilus TaxID=2067960 RepID=A0A2I6S9C4_9RHOO|nr:histidine kinase [Pseudazoarcus pumilus]AUN95831.1 hypothetical protein C0099_13375 [Pseudazoarcus pumilus]